jgi:hypothetical protein
MSRLEFDVFGRRLLVERTDSGWTALYPGSEGKHRVAHGIVIPPDTPETDLERYLADLCHEWASPERSTVRRLG